MKIQEALGLLFERQDLSREQMTDIMKQVMTGQATPAQIGALLAALRMKGESVDEVAAAATVMRELATGVSVENPMAIDIVGTGGDASHTFNVSTCSAFVCAAGGVPVAKHGNRSVSSKSGAADFLEAAGVDIELDPAGIADCVNRVGVGFMFAQRHHSAMKHAIGPRREMGVRTIFNLLGPMTNPAGVKNQVLGVYDRAWVRPVAEVLERLGSRHVMVVHGDSSLDEISITGPTSVAELKDGVVSDYSISPAQFGLAEHPLTSIQVDGPEQSMAMVESVFSNQAGAARDIVCLNAGAGLYVGGATATLEEGVSKAAELIASGKPREVLAQLVAHSRSLSPKAQ